MSSRSSPPAHSASNPQAGFTLVELLVAMVIGVLVILGATQLFIASQQSYRITTALANMQDTGRFALETLSRELRQTDFKGGCVANQINVSIRGQGNTSSPAPALQGFATPRNLALYNALDNPLPNAQSIAFRAAGTPVPITITNVSDQQFSFQTQSPGAHDLGGHLVLLQGVQKCDLFFNAATQPNRLQKNTTGWPSNSPAAAPLSYVQGQTAMLTALDSAIYYLGSDNTNTGAPSLMRLDTSTPTPRNEVLASHIAALRARFLVGEEYLPMDALSADQWERVRAVRISLIVQSERTDLRQAPTTIATGNFRSSPFSANDGRLYQAFTTTITLRNRP
ncbi:PilW family protein [Vreelandella sp. EE22]